MKPLYHSDAVRRGLGPCLRPGGDTLTRRMLALLAPPPGAVVLDGGCGAGATVALLRAAGLRAFGCELDPGLAEEAASAGLHVVRGDLAMLPLADGCLDLALCECALNLTERGTAARELFRVLRPGGRLGLVDIYHRGPTGGEWPLACCFAGASDLAAVERMIAEAGFAVELVEDHSPLLTHTAAQFVFAHGSLAGFWQAVLGDAALAEAACAAAAASRPGLFLLIARRSSHERP